MCICLCNLISSPIDIQYLHFVQQREKNQACLIDLSEDDVNMIDNKEEVAKKFEIPSMESKDTVLGRQGRQKIIPQKNAE
jgi:hypothetical protein